MTQLVIDGRKSADMWTHLADNEAPVPADFTVGIHRWLAERRDLVDHAERAECSLGVRIAFADEVARLASDLNRLSLVVIEIANSSDGRFFSMAARLREQLGFRGEVRVTGEVAPDQLSFMRRCGIDAFELGEHVDIERFIHRYRRYYQSSGPLTSRHNLIRVARRRRFAPVRGAGSNVVELRTRAAPRQESA